MTSSLRSFDPSLPMVGASVCPVNFGAIFTVFEFVMLRGSKGLSHRYREPISAW